MKTLFSGLSILALGLTLSACAAMKSKPNEACNCHGSAKTCECSGTSKESCDCGKNMMKGDDKAAPAKMKKGKKAVAPAAQ